MVPKWLTDRLHKHRPIDKEKAEMLFEMLLYEDNKVRKEHLRKLVWITCYIAAYNQIEAAQKKEGK